MNLQTRILWSVALDPPRYTVAIPYADRPTESVKITVPIKAHVRTRAEARGAAMQEMQALTDTELALLVTAAGRQGN